MQRTKLCPSAAIRERGVLRFRFNNINDRLRLGEVDTSVHKGTLRKFAGFSHAHIMIYKQFPRFVEPAQYRRDTEFLPHLLPCRMRGLSLITQNLVDGLVRCWIHNGPVLNRSILAVHQRNGASALEQAIYNRKTILAANTNNTSPPMPGGVEMAAIVSSIYIKISSISIIYYAFHKTYEIKIHRFDLLLTIYVLDISIFMSSPVKVKLN